MVNIERWCTKLEAATYLEAFPMVNKLLHDMELKLADGDGIDYDVLLQLLNTIRTKMNKDDWFLIDEYASFNLMTSLLILDEEIRRELGQDTDC